MASPESPQSPGGGYTGPVPPGGWAQPPAAPMGQMPMSHGALAGWGSRVGAYLLDILILLVPTAILIAIVVAAALGSDAAGIVTGIVSLLVYITVTLLYAPLLMKREGPNNGQTWGKQVVGIRAVRDSGQPFDFGSAALREVVLKGLAVVIAASIIPIIPWFLNYFWPLWDDQNRALHDMVVSTHVVRA